MPVFGSQQGIGRGETAESRVEAPFLIVFMLLCAAMVLVVHLYLNNTSLTLALAVSLLVFGATVVRVDLGVYILVIAMLLSPEVQLSGQGSAAHEFKIRYDDLLIIVIFFGVLVKAAFERRQMLWRPNPINSGIVLYYLICIISSLLAVRANLGAWDRRDAFFVLLKMAEYYMIFILVCNAVHSLDEVRRQLTLFFIVAMIVCGLGFATMGSTERLGTPFQAEGAEPNTLGGYLMVVMCIAAALLTQAPKMRLRVLFAVVTAAAFIPFLFTLSRASYVALLVAIAALGILTRKAYVLVAVVLVLVLSPFLMPPDVKDRVNYTFQRGSGEPVVIAGHSTGLQVDKSTYERVYVWDKVFYTLSIAPWFGGGVSWGKILDSQYARVIMETGLLGMAAFLFMQYRIMRTAREARRWGRTWMGRGLAVGVLAATIGLITHSLGTISFLIVRIMEPYWFLVALTVAVRTDAIDAYARRLAKEKESAPQPHPELRATQSTAA